MRFLGSLLFPSAALSGSTATHTGLPFSGSWSIDLRTDAERARNAECGRASFVLTQSGERITGSHTMSTVGCDRLNEGGEGTVKGVVLGARAVLVVTSGRNGGMVMGTAKLRNGALQWQTTEEVRPGEPEGDSPLILGRGVAYPRRKSETKCKVAT